MDYRQFAEMKAAEFDQCEREQREHDDLIARAAACARRHRPDDVVVKTYDPAETQPTTIAATSDDTWNAWADDKINRKIDMLAEIIGEETGKNEKKIWKEIKKLRAEIEILRSGKVVDIKGSRDAA
jgi:hypothetical protein